MVSDEKRGKQSPADWTARSVSRFGHRRLDARVMELRWRRDAAPRQGSDSDQAVPGRRSTPRASP